MLNSYYRYACCRSYHEDLSGCRFIPSYITGIIGRNQCFLDEFWIQNKREGCPYILIRVTFLFHILTRDLSFYSLRGNVGLIPAFYPLIETYYAFSKYFLNISLQHSFLDIRSRMITLSSNMHTLFMMRQYSHKLLLLYLHTASIYNDYLPLVFILCAQFGRLTRAVM